MAWVKLDLAQGLNLDAQPEELPAGVASSASNVRFRAGSIERFKGLANVKTPAITPYHITHFTVGATRFMVYAGTQKTYAWDGTTETDITNANNTGGVDDRYTGGILNGVYIQNNGVDVPQYWGGNTANNLANLTAWPAGYTVGFMRPWRNVLVCGDVTKSGTRYKGLVLVSHTADPGTIPASWDAADATKDAIEQPIDETDGALIDGMALGGVFALYKEDAIHYMQHVGGSFIYRFERFPGNTGLLARGCLASTPMGHVFLTPGFDLVLFNGQGEPQSVIEGRYRKWLETNMNAEYSKRSFVAVSPDTYEVLLCFPSGGNQSCDKALVWNWLENKAYIRELNSVTYGSTGEVSIASTDTWASDSGVWSADTTVWSSTEYAPNSQRLIFTRTTPTLTMYEASQLDYGSSFTASIEWTGMHLDAPETVKLVRSVRPVIDAIAGTTVSIQVGGSMTPDVAPTWSDAVTFTVGTDVEAHSFASGRYLSLRISTTGNPAWRLKSAQIDVVPQGNY